ncbi:MAG: hypothetical protein ACI9YE_003095 [Psychroserpens sp.]
MDRPDKTNFKGALSNKNLHLKNHRTQSYIPNREEGDTSHCRSSYNARQLQNNSSLSVTTYSINLLRNGLQIERLGLLSFLQNILISKKPFSKFKACESFIINPKPRKGLIPNWRTGTEK